MRAAAAYVRISRDREGQALGVARQEADSRALAERRGWVVAAVYSDNDVTASGKRRRPSWEAMLEAMRAGRLAGASDPENTPVQPPTFVVRARAAAAR